jgi:CRP/FNR family transcriptional regulator, dissimilatory nitrate respiration regulator
MELLEQLFAHLPASARPAATERVLRKDEHLFHRGDAPTAMFAVLEGEVRLVRLSAQGAMIVFQRAPNGFLAEASLNQPAYHCDAIAMRVSRVATIPRPVFRQALADERFGEFWLNHLGRELRRVRAQVERVNFRAASDRIAHYIETEGTNGEVTLTQTRKAWAEELGLSHEALYRQLRAMTTAGKLRIVGNSISLT